MARIWLEGELEFDSELPFEEVWEHFNMISEACGYVTHKYKYALRVFGESGWLLEFRPYGNERVMYISQLNKAWERSLEENS